MVRTTMPTLRHTWLTSTAMTMPRTVCTTVVAAVKTRVTISARLGDRVVEHPAVVVHADELLAPKPLHLVRLR